MPGSGAELGGDEGFVGSQAPNRLNRPGGSGPPACEGGCWARWGDAGEGPPSASPLTWAPAADAVPDARRAAPPSLRAFVAGPGPALFGPTGPPLGQIRMRRRRRASPTRRSRSARPRDPSRTPPRRQRCHTPGHACNAQPRSRALEAASHTPTLPLTHRAPGNVTHSPHAHSHSVTPSYGVSQGQTFELSVTRSHLQCFPLWNVPCRVIHCNTLRYIATTNSDTQISPIVSHVVTNTVNSALQGRTLITQIQPSPQ